MAKSGRKPLPKIKATPTAIGAVLGGVAGLIAGGKDSGVLGAVLGIAGGAVAGNFFLATKKRR